MPLGKLEITQRTQQTHAENADSTMKGPRLESNPGCKTAVLTMTISYPLDKECYSNAKAGTDPENCITGSHLHGEEHVIKTKGFRKLRLTSSPATSGEHFAFLCPNLPTMRSSRSEEHGLMRVQMSIVNRVLLLLKIEAKEDMRAASMTANIRPRRPAVERRQEGRKIGLWGGVKTYSLDCTSLSCILVTIWHDGHHQFGISNVGASHLGPTHFLAHLRNDTAHLICSWRKYWFLI